MVTSSVSGHPRHKAFVRTGNDYCTFTFVPGDHRIANFQLTFQFFFFFSDPMRNPLILIFDFSMFMKVMENCPIISLRVSRGSDKNSFCNSSNFMNGAVNLIGLFSRFISPDMFFRCHRCTVRSFTVSFPKALLMFNAAFVVFWFSLYS